MGIELKEKEIEKRQLRKKKLKLSVKEINSAGNEGEIVEKQELWVALEKNDRQSRREFESEIIEKMGSILM